MAFNTYHEGLKLASDIANRAIGTEGSLSSLSPVASPIPTLSRAFTLYVQAAEAYSHLLQSALVPASERAAVQRKWRLVLERAEKVKRKVEDLGAKVGTASIDEDAEEAAVCRRGANINGFKANSWRGPPPNHEFTGDTFHDSLQPQLAAEQLALDPEWAPLPAALWDTHAPRWEVRQGPGADCSVTAGLGACLAHNARWGTKLCEDALHPQAIAGRPRRSENAKHVVKLLLNGIWRSVLIDALLPRCKSTHEPLHITAEPAGEQPEGSRSTGPAWIPIAVKGYFKALGGYSIPGSDPAPDVYAFTGWIPERLEMNSGFQREKEWARMHDAWRQGHVILTLGSGKEVAPGLVPLHAYGVTGVEETNGERVLHIFDPGSSQVAPRCGDAHRPGETTSRVAYSFSMTWDEVCSKFETLNLNWDPSLLPVTAERHWSWPKPERAEDEVEESLSLRASPRYRLVATPSRPNAEVWLLLSQHDNSKDIPMDDIALHVFRDYRGHKGQDHSRLVAPSHEEENPYTNALHTLVRFSLRDGENVINAMPSRDRGLFHTGFTLRAFASPGTALSLTRVGLTMPFSESVHSQLTKRTAGGNPGFATHHKNPQYRLTVGSPTTGSKKVTLRLSLRGAKDLAWNVKLLWGQGERVFELSSEAILAASGAYSYGRAYCEMDNVEPGTYTVLVSSYERDQVGEFTLNAEASAPVSMTPIPQEGAGMFVRTITGKWDEHTAGGRPSGNNYGRNPHIEVTLPKPATVSARLTLPTPAPVPINLTVFKRKSTTGSDGTESRLGEQVATTGPYVERISGVCTGRHKALAGLYVLVPSTYNAVLGDWVVDIWADTAFSVEPPRPGQ